MISFVIPSMRARRGDLVACLGALRRETAGIPSQAFVVVEDDAAAADLAEIGRAHV